MSDRLRRMLEMHYKLHQLIDQHGNESEIADAYREEMEPHWYALTAEECDQFRKHLEEEADNGNL